MKSREGKAVPARVQILQKITVSAQRIPLFRLLCPPQARQHYMVRFCYFLFFFLLHLLNAGAQTWIPRAEISFDFSRLRRLESGPPGHIYALDERMNLALIRFDTLHRNSANARISAELVSVLPLRYWPGFEKESRSFDFSSVSNDGRHLALSLISKKIIRRDVDGSPVFAAAKNEVFVIDFPARKLDFRAETGKKTSSVFFGQTLRYTDYRKGLFRILAKDPEEPKPRIFLHVAKGKSPAPGRHLSLSNEGLSEKDEISLNDDLLGLRFQVQAKAMLIEKEGYTSLKIPLPASDEPGIFRYREGVLLLSDSGTKARMIKPGNLEMKEITLQPAESKEAVDFRSCLLNGQIIVGFSKSCFTFLQLSDGRRSKSLPLQAGKSSEVPRAGLSGVYSFLGWLKAGKMFRFLPSRREFSMLAYADSAGFQFPVHGSKRFRIRTARFLGDSNRQKDESRFGPGVFLNGKRISSYAGNSLSDFLRPDVSEKAGRCFLSYLQPRILALDREAKTVWAADHSSPVLALKADAEGKSLFTWCESGTVDFWNAETGKKYLSLLFDSSGKEWLLWTPSGYFDASSGGASLLDWLPPSETDRFPGVFSMSFFNQSFHKPELVDAVLLCRDEATALQRLRVPFGAITQDMRLKLRPPHIYLEFPGDKISYTSAEVALPYFEVAGRMPLKKVQLLLNGKPLPDYLPDGKELIRLSPPEDDSLLELIPYSAAGPGERIRCRLLRSRP